MAEAAKEPITLEDKRAEGGPDRTRQFQIVLDKGLKEEYEKCLREFTNHCDALLKHFNPPSYLKPGELPKEFVEHLEKIAGRQAYEALRGWKFYRPLEVSHAYRHDVGRELHRLRMVDYVCGLVVRLLGKEGKRSSSEDKALHWCLKLLFDYSDYSKEVALDIMKNQEFITKVLEVLHSRENINILTAKKIVSSSEDDHLQKVLFIMYNVARFPPSNKTLHDLGLTDRLLPCLMSPREDIQLASLGALANIVPVEKKDLFQTHDKPLRYLLGKLGKATSPGIPLVPKALKAGIWSFYELGQVVRQLALNEHNRRLLVKEGVLPRLLGLAKSEDIPTQRVALAAMWNLAFDKDNRVDMVGNSKLIDTLYTFRGSPDLRDLSFGILWTLREELKSSLDYKSIVKELEDEKNQDQDDTSPLTPASRAHILVKFSYNPYNNKIVQHVRDQLVRSGCHVLGSGSSLPDKLRVVEKAMVVVICMSQEFKDSPECQSEVDHVLELQKSYIPLLLDQAVQVDGWLRRVVQRAQNHFFTFSMALLEDPILAREVQERGKVALPQITRDLNSLEVSEAALETVRQWNPDVLNQWIARYKLPRDKLAGMTGRKLAGWMKLKSQAPEFFFRSVETKLGLSLLDGEVFDFADAIDAIPRMCPDS